MSIINKIKNSKFAKNIAAAIACLTIPCTMPAKAEELIKPDILQLKQPPSHDFNLKLNTKEMPDFQIIDISNPEEKSKRLEKKIDDIMGSATFKDADGQDNITSKLKGKKDVEKELTAERIFSELPIRTVGSYGVRLFLVHEALGHALTAKLLGCDNVRIIGPSKKYGAVADVLGDYPPEGLSIYESNLISAAGFAATDSASSVLYQILKTGKVPESLRPIVATTALVSMLDRHTYLLGTALLNYLRLPMHGGNDIHQIMVNSFSATEGRQGNIEGKYRHIWQKDLKGNFNWKDFSKATKSKIDAAYGVALGMSAIELALRWKEIKYLMGTALGNNPKIPEGFDVIHTGLFPLPEGGFIANVYVIW